MSEQPVQESKPKINGEPLDLEDLLALAEIDSEDIASALIFFDDNAPDGVKGTLE
jgi:hypothetical protein